MFIEPVWTTGWKWKKEKFKKWRRIKWKYIHGRNICSLDYFKLHPHSEISVYSKTAAIMYPESLPAIRCKIKQKFWKRRQFHFKGGIQDFSQGAYNFFLSFLRYVRAPLNVFCTLHKKLKLLCTKRKHFFPCGFLPPPPPVCINFSIKQAFFVF